MSYSATVNLGTVGSDITGQTVSISGCTGASCGSGCTSLVTSQGVYGFPKVITGIPDNVVSLFVKVDGGSCAGTTQCITVTGGGVATPTPTITSTITPTMTITPTSPACVTSVQFEVDSAGDVRYVDCCGNTIYLTFGIGPQVINDCLQYGSLFAVGATISNVSYSVTSCVCPPPSTPTPTPLPTYEGIIVKLQGASGTNGNLTVYQSSDNITFTSSLTITTTDNQLTQQTFNGTPGYYYYFIVARTSGTSNRLNWYTQVSPSDFNPGPINGAGCTNSPGDSTLQSDTFQLPNPVQSTSQIIFYGDISDACL